MFFRWYICEKIYLKKIKIKNTLFEIAQDWIAIQLKTGFKGLFHVWQDAAEKVVRGLRPWAYSGLHDTTGRVKSPTSRMTAEPNATSKCRFSDLRPGTLYMLGL
jgi:hypothetical protein